MGGGRPARVWRGPGVEGQPCLKTAGEKMVTKHGHEGDLRTVKVRSSAYKCNLRAGPWLLPSREPSACPLLLSRSPLYVQSVRGAVKSIQFLVFNVKCALDHFITIKD